MFRRDALDMEIVHAAIRNLKASDSVTTLYYRVLGDLRQTSLGCEIVLSESKFKDVLAHSKSFVSVLIETQLLSSYNTYHGEQPISKILEGFFEEIGGVATDVGVIKDLVNSETLVLDNDMILMQQNKEAGNPFKEAELGE